MEYTVLLSFLLLAAGCAVIVCVLYVVQKSGKPLLHKLLCALGVCLALWSFGLAMVLCSPLQTQFLVWSITPGGNVMVEGADHMVRLGLIGLVAAMSLSINKIYGKRLRANAGHIYRQTLISEISQSLLWVDERNLGEKMMGILSQCGSILQCERGCLMLWDQPVEKEGRCFEWTENGAEPWNDACQALMLPYFSKLHAPLGNELLAISDMEKFPQRLEGARAYLTERQVVGFLLLPILKNGREHGVMAFATVQKQADWDGATIDFLSIIANTVADAVVKMEDARRIEWIAYHDTLTELPNRLFFQQRLCEAVERAKESGPKFGVAFIDLDSFKSINDAMGHEFGDLLLKELAGVISAHVGEGGMVARFGGDEFALLLTQGANGEGDVIGRVRAVLHAIRNPVVLRGQEFFITGSIGVSFFPKDGEDAETLMKNADIAMYEAKNLGKNQYALCTKPLKQKATDNAKLAHLLYRALERKQLLVYYQPQMNIRGDSIVGLEALLRWKIPGRGIINPAEFIPLAEQTGLIQSIGAWVLEEACRQNKIWQQRGFPRVRLAVNVSAQQLENKGFVQQVADILERTGLEPAYLELEMTEGIANNGSAGMAKLMNGLKRLGVSLSIDDFGTEYSSLERLKMLPVDRIKMDIQFVQGIEASDKDRAITEVIIHLAKSLHMKVIAEGVETETQLGFLSRGMCDEVQGYYYYKPMPARGVEAVFRRYCAVGADA